MPHTLTVRLNDRHVGTITNLATDHNVFTFDPSYLTDPTAPILSLGLFNADRKLVNPSKTPQVRLLPFFANLLPEGHLREYLAARAGVNPLRDFPLLWLTGHDLPGAVIIEHPEGAHVPADDDNVVLPEAQADPSILKFSLAGVQLKFSAIRQADGGLTIPLHGVGGDWILKMPSATFRLVPENEFAMLTFAREVGIEVSEMFLGDPSAVGNLPKEVRGDLGRGLFIRRFDRDGRRRIHMEDFNQIFAQYPADKYKNVSYANMLAGIWSLMGEEGAREFVRRLVFNIGIGNGDMHLKNWSLIYRDGITPELSPAYDYVATRAYIGADKLALTIARSREWSEMTYDRFERFARRAEVPSGLVVNAAREIVDRMQTVWPTLKPNLELPPDLLAQIDSHMASVPLFGASPAVPAGLPDDAKPEQPEIA
ncbi:MAG: type II toxin-antitoxin system HipA family toxin [Candidatus Baltobacteraceae bacterium]